MPGSPIALPLDATGHNVAAVVPGAGGMRVQTVCLTAEGRAFLQRHAA